MTTIINTTSLARQLIKKFCKDQTQWTVSLQDGEILSLPYFNAVTIEGSALQSHGMTKEHPLKAFDALLSLFNTGINRNNTNGRRGYLDSAPLTAPAGEGLVGATATGTTYKDGPFILVAQTGILKIDETNKIAAVLINQAIAEKTPELPVLLQKLLPNTVMVRAYSDVSDAIQHANRLPLEKASLKAATPCPWYNTYGSQDTPSPNRPLPHTKSRKLTPPPQEIILPI